MRKFSQAIPRLSVLASLALLQGCFLAREYQGPDSPATEELYRQDSSAAKLLSEAKDSISSAALAWNEIFQDSLLRQHIDTALSNNQDLLTALERIRQSEAMYRQSRRGFWPSFQLNAKQNHQELAPNSQFGGFFTTIDQYELSGTLSWEADIWGKITSQKRAQQAALLETEAAYRTIRSGLVASVAKAYFRLISLDEEKRVLHQTIANRQEGLQATRALYEAGRLTSAALEQTRAQLLDARALRVQTLNDIRLQENALSVLLGKAPQSLKRGSLENDQLPDSLNTGIPYLLVQYRPDIQQAEQGLRKQFQLTQVARSQFYPQFQITASSGFQSLQLQELITPQSIFLNLLSSLTQPVLQRGQLQANLESAHAEQQIALLNFQQVLLRAGREVSDATTQIATADSLRSLRQSQVEAYQRAVEASQSLVENGQANYLEVIQARENLLAARLSSIRSRQASLNGLTQLYRALGGGWQPKN